MDRELMAKEDLNKMGFSSEARVQSAEEYDKSKEREGYIAGKHIERKTKWWFQRWWMMNQTIAYTCGFNRAVAKI